MTGTHYYFKELLKPGAFARATSLRTNDGRRASRRCAAPHEHVWQAGARRASGLRATSSRARFDPRQYTGRHESGGDRGPAREPGRAGVPRRPRGRRRRRGAAAAGQGGGQGDGSARRCCEALVRAGRGAAFRVPHRALRAWPRARAPAAARRARAARFWCGVRVRLARDARGGRCTPTRGWTRLAARTGTGRDRRLPWCGSQPRHAHDPRAPSNRGPRLAAPPVRRSVAGA